MMTHVDAHNHRLRVRLLLWASRVVGGASDALLRAAAWLESASGLRCPCCGNPHHSGRC